MSNTHYNISRLRIKQIIQEEISRVSLHTRLTEDSDADTQSQADPGKEDKFINVSTNLANAIRDNKSQNEIDTLALEIQKLHTQMKQQAASDKAIQDRTAANSIEISEELDNLNEAITSDGDIESWEDVNNQSTGKRYSYSYNPESEDLYIVTGASGTKINKKLTFGSPAYEAIKNQYFKIKGATQSTDYKAANYKAGTEQHYDNVNDDLSDAEWGSHLWGASSQVYDSMVYNEDKSATEGYERAFQDLLLRRMAAAIKQRVATDAKDADDAGKAIAAEASGDSFDFDANAINEEEERLEEGVINMSRMLRLAGLLKG